MTRLLGFLTSLFRRDGAATILKIFRYAFSPKAWRWLMKNLRDRRIVKGSGLVDEDWYRREYPDVAEKGVDPVQDFLTPPHSSMRLPNPDFVPGEYAVVNLDVKVSGMQPGIHYAANGIRESRPVSTLEHFEKPFPSGTVELRREFPAAGVRHRRTAIFASFSDDGRIKETVLFYLRGLKEVVDNIVFIANCPVFPGEVDKLDGLVRLAVFRHHGCYDFGSYKIGWNEAKALGLLDPDACDELVVCNDSCYGPVYPFQGVFDEMARRERKNGMKTDFWGMSIVLQYGRRMIPSYFYVFGPAVLEGSELGRWFERMEPCRNRGQVIIRCESMLTEYLIGNGYACDGLVPQSFQTKNQGSPIKFPLATLRDYRDPLVKIKALKGDCLEDLEEVGSFIRKENPELAAILPTFSRKRRLSGLEVPAAARRNHADSLRETESRLRSLRALGKPIETVLLSLSGDEAWIRSLGAELPRSDALSVTVSTIPDMRLSGKSEILVRLRAARERLSRTLPETRAVAVRIDADGEWPDILPRPGIVFYASASDWSDFRYNPHFAIGRDILPVLFFDRRTAGPYPLEKEFARQNYAYFWKVFFTDREAFDLYKAHSIRKGENAVLCQTAADAIRSFTEFPLADAHFSG